MTITVTLEDLENAIAETKEKGWGVDVCLMAHVERRVDITFSCCHEGGVQSEEARKLAELFDRAYGSEQSGPAERELRALLPYTFEVDESIHEEA
jgi:hypothetical protein